MILKNFNYQYSKTSRWIYPLLVYYNNNLSKKLKNLNIIGCALADNKHKISIEENKLLIVISLNGEYDYSNHKFKNSNCKEISLEIIKSIITENSNIDYYEYYNDNSLIGVLKIPLELVPKQCIDCIFESKYSKLYDYLGTMIFNIYDYHCISIIKKEPSAEKAFKELVSAKLGVDSNTLQFDEYEFEFIKEKEILFNAEELEDINLRKILEHNIDQIKHDLKLSIENRYDIENKVMLYNIELAPQLAEYLLQYLENSKDSKKVLEVLSQE